MFDLILADPPWQYAQRAPHAVTKFGGGVSQCYDLMSNDEIYSLGHYIRPLMADSCVLLLWAVWPKLDIALRTMLEWGFKYSTVGFVWEKITKTGDPATGPGFWTASNTEPVLLGFRGPALTVQRKLLQQVIRAPRGEHSVKPQEVHTRLEQMFGSVARLELFARRETPGWLCLGNELTGNDIREDLALLRIN